jgi:hypothetical protein
LLGVHSPKQGIGQGVKQPSGTSINVIHCITIGSEFR